MLTYMDGQIGELVGLDELLMKTCALNMYGYNKVLRLICNPINPNIQETKDAVKKVCNG